MTNTPDGSVALSSDRRTLTSLVTDQVQRTPDAVAVLDGDRELTYRELQARADTIAARLVAEGIGREDLVAVCLPRDADMVAAVLGIHRAGAAYVPLDPAYPHDRLRLVVGDCAPRAMLVAPGTRQLGEDLVDSTTTVLVDTGTIGTHDTVNVPGPAPEDAAYVIYTSGSTGRPKGAVLEHRNTVAMLDHLHTALAGEDMSGVLFSTSLCFDLSVFEIFGTLTMGGTVIVAENGLALPELAHRDRVTLVNTVPSVITTLAREGDLPPSVRTVILSGDVVTRAVADAAYSVPTVERVYNFYGPTEAVTWQIGTLVDRGAEEPPIGTPFLRAEALIVDDAGAPVPDGVVGELVIAGDHVCRGYLGRPDLTAERFGVRDGLRTYRTGDLASRDARGVIRCHGRADFQVKIRGFRVELGDIEAALAQHPGVEDLVAVTVGEDAETRRVVVYVQAGSLVGVPGVTTAGGILTGAPVDTMVRDLLDVAATRLPDYMIPSSVVVLEEMPRTPNGKRDRAGLPSVTDAVASSPATGTRPDGPLEQLVASVWAEVLGVAAPPADVAFGALGGDSLRAASVVSRLRRSGLAASLGQLGPQTTVRELAALAHPATADTVDVLTHSDEVAAATVAQQEFWIGEQLSGPASAQWTVPLQVRLSGPVDPGTLRGALDAMLVRHPALRTAIRDSGRTERVAPRQVPLQEVDLRGLDRELQRVRADEIQLAEARRPLSLATGDLVRAVLVRLGDDLSELLLHVHHCAIDGLSTGPLLRDLADVYAALRSGSPLPSAPTTTFDDAARWLEAEARERAEARAAHWAERLSGTFPEQDAPGGPLAAPEGPWAGGRVEVPVHAADREAFGAFTARHGVTAYALVLASAAVRIHRETGRTDVVLAAPVSTRGHHQLEDTVGLLLQMAMVRCDVTGAPTFAELVARVADVVAADLAVGLPPWAELLRLSGLARTPDAPRSQLLTIAMQRGEPAVVSGEVRWEYLRELDNGGAKADLTLFWEVDNPAVPHLAAEFARERYAPRDAERILRQVLAVARAGCASPHVPVTELEWVETDDRERLDAWSGAAEAEPAPTSVPAAVLAAATAAPHAVAVDCPHVGPVTYAELLGAAWRVAAALPDGEVPVAVAAIRSARGIAAALGTWLAGRAYLPVDVGHPPARLADMLADSRVETLLADVHCPPIAVEVGRISLEELLPSDPSGWAPTEPHALGSADPAPGATAYRIYTSGSTGRPKGVTVGHAALASFLAAMDGIAPVGHGEAMAYVTTPSFDISGLEVWQPLTRGGTVRVVDDATVKDGFALAARIAGCRVVQMTPTGWQVLLEAGWAGDPAMHALVGGEAVPPALAGRLAALVGQAWNVYGPTETTIWSTAHRLEPGDAARATVPVGRPLRNSVVHVLDAGGRLVPPGVVGEICVGGFGVADGYAGQPALTAERFVELPGLPDGGAGPRFYRTGDLGRWRDGVLECLGRTDGQVKVRGVRMEIGEIEAVLARQAGVEQCAVGVDQPGSSAARLVGYVVGPAAAETPRLEAALAARLPAAYVPRVWVALDAMPLTGNGKVARNRLPAPLAPAAAFEPPATEVEELVAELWAEVLEVDRVGRSDSFMTLGGHSLLATRVTALLREELALAVPVRLLFEHPRLADFARELEQLLLADLGDTEQVEGHATAGAVSR